MLMGLGFLDCVADFVVWLIGFDLLVSCVFEFSFWGFLVNVGLVFG